MSVNRKIYKNRKLPVEAERARRIERWIGMPFNGIEFVLSYVYARPWQYLLSCLDSLSYKLENTLLRVVLSHLVFPVTLIITLAVGFKFSEDGFTVDSLLAFSLILLSYGLIFAPMERLMPWSREWLSGGNDTSVDLMMFYSGVVWNAFAKFSVTVIALSYLVDWVEPYGHEFWPSSLPGVVQVFLFLLLKDFPRYWYHRALHTFPSLWRFHAVHHSVGRLYWLNGIRAHPGEIVLQALLFAIPTALLQPGEDIVLVSLFMALSIGIFQHANLDMKLGFWEYIFSIGDNHRYHHSPDKEVGDSNYGGEFIVWDILFGTFHNPKNQNPSEKIGIASAPNYPMTWMGLMIAPFLPNQKIFSQVNTKPTEEEP